MAGIVDLRIVLFVLLVVYIVIRYKEWKALRSIVKASNDPSVTKKVEE